MKIFGLVLVCLVGCSHPPDFAGVHDGRRLYKLQCDSDSECIKGAQLACCNQPWRVAFQWADDGDKYYMVECATKKEFK